MTATYTFDVFSSLDGYGAASANWTGYWGKQGPELLDHRLALYGTEQRMVFGAKTHRLFAEMLASSTEESEVRDPWVTAMWTMPATVVSTTLQEPLDWPHATVASGDAVDVVARLTTRSSRVQPTSTSSCSRTGRSTVTSWSSSTGRLCIPESLQARRDDGAAWPPVVSAAPATAQAERHTESDAPGDDRRGRHGMPPG